MSRTRLFAQLRRSLAAARAELPDAPHERAISRRAAIGLMAAATAAACAPKAKPQAPASPIVIIGGGTSGLTTAYRLASAGRACAIFESTGRTGGRMFTKRDFNADGMFCELGGELVDTRHVELMALAKELGVGIERLRPTDQEFNDIYDFGGKLHTTKELIDPASSKGAFIPVASRIAADQAALLDADGNWTDRARELDALPLSKYIESLRGSTDDWVLDFLTLAYFAEYGVPAEEQSALNLVDFIGTDIGEPFSVFGESDEAFRIAGGSQSLPDALAAKLAEPALAAHATMNLNHELANIAHDANGFTLRFNTKEGTTEVKASQVVMTIPFTRLRKLDGLGGLGLSPAKMTAINEMGYGVNSKLMVGTRSRPWQNPAVFGQKAPVSGTIYSERDFQMAWDTSAAQAGQSGILTNFLSGPPALTDEATTLAAFEDGLRDISPQIADALMKDTRASFFWPKHPQTLGSYSAPKVGQYTSVFETAGDSDLGGALLFAGEHTSPEHYGFMNGAVDSGERTAKTLLG